LIRNVTAEQGVTGRSWRTNRVGGDHFDAVGQIQQPMTGWTWVRRKYDKGGASSLRAPLGQDRLIRCAGGRFGLFWLRLARVGEAGLSR
jgi:hypothetical protein